MWILNDRRGVVRDDDPRKLDRVAQRFIARLEQRHTLNYGAQSRHRGDGDQREEPDLVTQRGRFDAKDFQSHPDAGEQNGGLPTPHKQPHRAFGRSRDKRISQRVHFSPPFWTFWVWPPPSCQPVSARRSARGLLSNPLR